MVDEQSKLVGIVTNRDLRFQTDTTLRISEVMTKDNIVTTTNPDLAEASQILLRHKIEKLPVVDSDNKLVGLITYRDITKIRGLSECLQRQQRSVFSVATPAWV